MSIAKFSVKNPQIINMIMLVVFIWGIYTMIDIPKEEMPAIERGAFIISVSYRGVSPQQLETSVAKKIEDKVRNVDDIDYLETTCREGMVSIYVSMSADADLDDAWNDINTEMDKVNDLPDDADDPVVRRISMREMNSICNISLGGNFSGNSIREIAEAFEDEILDVDYVSRVDISGTREREIWVESDANLLEQYNLTLNDVINAIRSRNISTPGGNIYFGKEEFLIRSVGEFETVDDIRNLILKTDESGRAIRIYNVAAVKDTLEEQNTVGKLNGVPAINMRVFKKAEGNIISVMEDIRAKAENFENQVPGLMIEIRNDGSIDVKNSINTLGGNALLGAVLVFVVLTLFIGWKNALFAAWGIPFSFLFTFILMRQFDVTINNLSLFGLILVLGMIVDDAIVVLENVHRNREMGMPLHQAVVTGTEEIMWPVISAVATTIAAFIPMLMMQGHMGKFMRIFPIVVTLALAASLFECLIILPSHIAELGGQKKTKMHKPNRLTLWLVNHYRKWARTVLKHRFLAVVIIVVALLASGSALLFGAVKFSFFPRRSSSTITLNVQTPSGTALEKTEEVVSQIEHFILNMDAREDVTSVVTTIGRMRDRRQWQTETSNAEIRIDLKAAEELQSSPEAIKNAIRKYCETVPGLYSYTFPTHFRGAPTGEDIELRIIGDNMTKLEEISRYVIQTVNSIPGTADLETSLQEGKTELQLKPQEEKMKMYGFTMSDIASFVNTASYGRAVAKFRGGDLDEYDILVRIPEEQMHSIADLKKLNIRSPKSGQLLPLQEIVTFHEETGYASIVHWNGKRVLTVSGNTTSYQNEQGKTVARTPSEVTEMLRGNAITGTVGLLSDFPARFPGYRLEYGGSAEEQAKTYNSLYVALAIALILIYSILSAQFRSYVQPLIVMLTIPFAFIGVIFGLLITNLPFSLNTLVSVVALAGVVVNDSLVLVDFVNKERDRGVDRWNSLINAGSVRLRPIILTSVTTIAGFLPIIFSTSEASSDWKPMAVSIAFGLAFATLLTLFVIPVFYSFVDSIFGKLGITRFKEHISFEEAMQKELPEYK